MQKMKIETYKKYTTDIRTSKKDTEVVNMRFKNDIFIRAAWLIIFY